MKLVLHNKYQSLHKSRVGFTLIELLIVVAIIAILAAVIFVALNPLKRFQDTRDARRFEDAANIVNALSIDQIDNGGTLLSVVDNLVEGDVYMIGTAGQGCDNYNEKCSVNVSADAKCVNLQGLIDEAYLGSIPISPSASTTWSALYTGYTLSSTSGVITVTSCESEGSGIISVSG